MPQPTDATPVVSMSNSDLVGHDRFSWYADVVREGIAPLTLASPYADDFTARVEATKVGVVRLTAFSFLPLSAVRTPAHIRRGDPETYQLGLVEGSPMRATQRREASDVQVGGLVFFDTSYPLEADFPDYGCEVVVSILSLPKSTFPLPSDHADRLLCRPLSSRSVTGSLLRHFMGSALHHVADQPTSESLRLGGIATDLVAAFLAGHLDSGKLLPVDTRTRALTARIYAFIDANLGDVQLTPAAIASQHHMSVRALHQLFSSEPNAVMGTVRRRRLERCREDLRDPLLQEQPIGAIAARWGFSSPAEFSRVFRRTYGTTPKEFRNESAQAHSLH
ncbi:helix-turn-helix domain-containing protein [Streptomyces sp. NPDC058195]|uniref:helix-turn-helix domain-containing protein n=1 Tax=Streptomyces sp. NPDC058195 TaxID=3346375 RepID=UPI0036E98FCE